jgi:hypothetical protein
LMPEIFSPRPALSEYIGFNIQNSALVKSSTAFREVEESQRYAFAWAMG